MDRFADKDKIEHFVFGEVDVIIVSSNSEHYMNNVLKHVVQKKTMGIPGWLAGHFSMMRQKRVGHTR